MITNLKGMYTTFSSENCCIQIANAPKYGDRSDDNIINLNTNAFLKLVGWLWIGLPIANRIWVQNLVQRTYTGTGTI